MRTTARRTPVLLLLAVLFVSSGATLQRHGQAMISADVNPAAVNQTVTFTITGLTRSGVEYVANIGGVDTPLSPVDGVAQFTWQFPVAGGYQVFVNELRDGHRRLLVWMWENIE